MLNIISMFGKDLSFYWDGSMPWCVVGSAKHLPLKSVDSQQFALMPPSDGSMGIIDCRIPESVREQIATRQIPNMTYAEYLTQGLNPVIAYLPSIVDGE